VLQVKTRTFRVVPRIPDPLSPLKMIAYNTWWTWNPQAVELFRWIDPDLWETSYHNPVRLLGKVGQDRLEELASDGVYLSHLEKTAERLDNYLRRKTWFDELKQGQDVSLDNMLIATFSAEFGLHESIPIYSGGLGVLAGDTLKSASELGLPMVGVSLLYSQGYFSQYLDGDGWQRERYFVNDYSNMPVNPVLAEDGSQVAVEFPMGRTNIRAAVWKVEVGRTALYLLDTNIPENDPSVRGITGQLYGGDREDRIRQEIVLGVGGLRALDAMGLTPSVRHINEGHSAFLILERIRQLMVAGLTFPEARELVSAGDVFTTHTPVPAGNEEFQPELVKKYVKPLLEQMGISTGDFLEFGTHVSSPNFSMTVFGLRFSRQRNAVSKLHGEVSRDIWKDVWPRLPGQDSPIGHVTNGIHPETWVSEEISRLFSRYIGPRWSSTKTGRDKWEKVEQIPDSEIWPAHTRLRERLVSWTRERWEAQIDRMGLPKPVNMDSPVLDPEALTIGFARRFATYKRATLLFSDEKRLARMVNNPDRPVQFIFAGKAHPHDNEGKELIRRIVHLCMKEEFYGRIVYLEDYSMDMARHMVQGVDVWLNTPRLPMEASGTSGMKACFNGAIHCSVQDGWWAEAYRKGNGWRIGSGEIYDSPETQDRLEAGNLYSIIENRMVPLFYSRDRSDLPSGWLNMVRESLKAVCPFFSTNRMLAEYVSDYYLPAFLSGTALSQDDYAGARLLADWMEKVRNCWPEVKIEDVETETENGVCSVGDVIPVRVLMKAPGLSPDDLWVEVQHGRVEPDGWLVDRTSVRLEFKGEENGFLDFSGTIECLVSGNHGLAVRVLPGHPVFGRVIEPNMVSWWD